MAVLPTATEIVENEIDQPVETSKLFIGERDRAGERPNTSRIIVVGGFLVLGAFITIACTIILVEIGSRESSIPTTRGSDNDTRQTDSELPLPVKPAERPAEDTNRAKPVPSDIVVCTVNGKWQWLQVSSYPEKLCDITFYDSVYEDFRKGSADTFIGGYNSFLNWPNVYPSAEFGVSFSLSSDERKQELLDSALKAEMKELYQYRITHTAVINLYGDSVTKDNFTAALDILKIAHQTYLAYKSKQSYVVLGAAIDDPSKHQLVELMKDHFVPSLFISVAHGSYDDRRRKDCLILPPTWLSTSVPNHVNKSHITYGRTLDDSYNLLSEVASIGVQVPMAISFSLSGRLYKPRDINPTSTNHLDYELFRPCVYYNEDYFISPGQICDTDKQWAQNIQKTQASDILYTFDSKMERTLTFDDLETLQNKVCELRDIYQQVPFGIAIFDINYDAWYKKCDNLGFSVHFARLALLRKMDQYLKSLTTPDLFNKDTCLSITT